MKTKPELTRSEIEVQLRDKGLQPTLQRVGICQYVLCEADHPSADQVHQWAEKNLGKISLATVYNTLKSLVGVGLLREFRFQHMEKAVFDNNLDKHHHFYDENSSRIYDVPADSVSLSAALGPDFKVDGYEILLKGSYKKVL